MKNVLCTVLSKSKFYQGLALYYSLVNSMEDFRLYILCMDDTTYRLLEQMKPKHVVITHVRELEKGSLLDIKKQRKLHEYCWTLKPVYIENLMIKHPLIIRITYVDADLFFWSDPAEIFKNQPYCSVLLSRGDPYYPTRTLKFINYKRELYGNYNSGFVSFKNDQIGLSSVQFWKENCLERCSDIPISGSFGDQTYLNFLPVLFPRVCDIATPGVNIGHWNCPKYNFYVKNGELFIDESKLICYHFSGFKITGKGKMKLKYEAKSNNLPFIYDIYKKTINRIVSYVEQINPGFTP